MSNLYFSPLIGNGMLMQHGVAFPLWGRSFPGAEVSALFRGESYHARADGDGNWQLSLNPTPFGGPFTMEVASAGETVVIQDIYAGDVWLAAGQSNMELPMQRLRDEYPEEWEAIDYPLIRQFKVPQEWDFSGPRADLQGGAWAAVSRETLGEFSGTGYFFAKDNYERHRVPVGIISTGWGGTPIEAWMSREALAAFPDKIAQGEKCAAPACVQAAAKTDAAIQEWEACLRRDDRGLAEGWQQPESWRELAGQEPAGQTIHGAAIHGAISLPGPFAGAGLDGFCGVIWLCREFYADAALAAADAKVWLGTITDADTVYINGTEVGGTAYRYPPRKYPIPAGLLRQGKNCIVIRVTCALGDGGVTVDKPFRIFNEKSLQELAGNWHWRVGVRAAQPRPEAFFFQRQPMGPYNAMISPVLKYPLKGVIWYQGESNDSCPESYEALFKAMIQDWRAKSGQKDLPFLFVQLPIYGQAAANDLSSPWAALRDAQKAALSLPDTGMAAALDLGEWNDLHPLNKKDVGRRLSLAAEKTVFKGRNTAPGPLHCGTALRDGRLYLKFQNCGAGLFANGTPYFSIVSNETLIRLPAVIEGPDSMSIDISSIDRPEKVLYAYNNHPEDRQLYNADGLPMVPFKVEIPIASGFS